MANKRYPVFNYLMCAACGVCINKCSHGFYEKKKAPTPIVVHRDNGIDPCHGCGDGG